VIETSVGKEIQTSQTVDYNRPCFNGVQLIILIPAGHIPGSAQIRS